jgi:Raf kinase inhibitor-like YbhB/YbcL family protein
MSKMSPFQLQCNSFENHGTMPIVNTVKGKNLSPPLVWKGSPENTKSYAFICIDLNSPLKLITHWIIYNIPANYNELPEGIPVQSFLTDGICQGRNWKREPGYTGPNPPFGKHNYLFKLFALDILLEKDEKMTRKKLLRVLKNHILAETELIGSYPGNPRV